MFRLVRPLNQALLLLVSRRWAGLLKERQGLWQSLCREQDRWRERLPKRPRKPWADVFCDMLSRELEAVRQ